MTYVELTEACHALFGQEILVSPDFITYLQPSGLKSAYRQLALQTHPDRATCLGVDQRALERRFHAVHSAYETLKPYVMERRPLPSFHVAAVAAAPVPAADRRSRKRARHPGSQEPARAWTPPAAPAAPTTPAPQADFFFTGSMPCIQLRLGQFLFYRRKISWWSVVHAMVWQQRVRPRLGQLAREHGWLDAREAQAVQQAAGAHELWGEAAIRCQILSRVQVAQLLARQRLLGQPIGRYFVEQGMISEVSLTGLLAEQQKHNRTLAACRT